MGDVDAAVGSAPVVVQAYRFALDPTPAQARALAAHAGASRFAYNRMLAEVKSTLTAREWERRLLGGCLTPVQGWSLAALRRTWNANKGRWAPWWPGCSKEAYNHGLEALASALKNWADSRDGRRRGRSVGFPRFKRRRARASFAYTTGSFGLTEDRRSVRLPRIGRVHAHESTRKLHRRVVNGTARIVRATVSRAGAGRWYCSFTVEVQRQPERASPRRHRVVGVDAGVTDLVVAATDDGGEVMRVPGIARRKPCAGKAGRGINRAIADATMADLSRMLRYKTGWYGSTLVVADRWFPSSKTCSGCGNRKPRLLLSERTSRCRSCGLVADRDLNAAVNLARWPRQASTPSPGSGPVEANYGRGAEHETDPARAGDAAGHGTSTPRRPPAGQTGTAPPQGEAAA